MVIMGIVNTKVPEVEPADSLVRKIESAAKYRTSPNSAFHRSAASPRRDARQRAR